MSATRTGLFAPINDYRSSVVLPPAPQNMDGNPTEDCQLLPYVALAGAAEGLFQSCLGGRSTSVSTATTTMAIAATAGACLCIGVCLCSIAASRCCNRPR